MSKISVITINYNDKEGLRKTLENVVNQTYSDFEYIVIDGNSSDGSKQVLEEYRDKIDYALSEPDSGIYNAMNKGIRAAKGEYLLFMNSGDCFFKNDTLEKAEKLIDGHSDIYYGDLVYYNQKKKRYENWAFPDKLSLAFFVENSLPHQGSFIRRLLFDSIGPYNEKLKIASDWEFFMIAICVKRVSYQHIDLIISEYDLVGISTDPKNYDLVRSEKMPVFNRYFPMVIDDYTMIRELESKRIRNIIYIKKFKFAWKLLKGFSNLLLLFLPKQNNPNKGYKI